MIVNQQYLIAVLLVLILKMKLKFGQTAKTLPTKILVIGGSGRVGGSAVRSIANRFGTSVEILVGGRKRDNWDAYMKHQNMSILKTIKFLELDITDDVELKSIVETVDLVIHTAGPFQGIKVPNVMETALLAGKKYLDVCDDVSLSRICRSNYYTSLAQRTGGSAIISTGIWPGGSSIFAQEVISRAGGASNVDKVVFSFFTAGSGNAGPTILTATFLILGENVLTYVDGKEVLRKSATDIKVVDFGKDIGEREVVRLNLIECESCYSSGIGNVETFFGTAPKLWNRLFVLMAQLIPQNVLRDRSMMANLANLSLPLVRLIDKLVGSTNGIRVDVTDKNGDVFTGLLTHNDLEKSVGDAIAAFAAQMLVDSVPPGVYFPEEVPGNSFRRSIMSDISSDAITYSIRKNGEYHVPTAF